MRTCRRTSASEPGVAALQRWLFTRVTAVAEQELASADECLVLGGRLSARERIGIYRHGYVARLVECLADDYPAVAHALGAPAFQALCQAFVAANPPASASLSFYGAPFAAFWARGDSPGAAFVAELARLEWALVEVIHADAERSFEPAALAPLGDDEWARLTFSPSPALRVLRCAYPVHAYYRAFVEERRPSPPAPEACGVAVCRRGDDVWRFGLAPPELGLLEQLCAGTPLGAALAAFEAVGGAADAASLERSFSDWVAAGFFAGAALG